jgi:UDP-N-acetyl-D-glucosamine dehydrogenase
MDDAPELLLHTDALDSFLDKVRRREATVAVVGLGYVGLPLAIAFARAGFKVLGLDVDATKVSHIERGEGYIKHIPPQQWVEHVAAGRFGVATDFGRAAEADALVVCVPTPLTRNRVPDMTYIENTARALGPRLKKGQLYSLESTTYPGTTDEFVRPILEELSGLKAGRDFFLSFSPEREDPGNPVYRTTNIPKVVGGLTERCRTAAIELYSAAIERLVPVSSAAVAEMTKVYENTFRGVNIALANEMKVLCDRMGIDVWEVINAASTKPFGFMPFYPGPGLGGHCIPLDPFYLTWKAHEYDLSTRFIELAGEINTSMPYYVVDKVQQVLNEQSRSLKGADVLVLGVAYKRGVDDMRESPALRVMELLIERGARVQYHDPHIPVLPRTREYAFDMSSIPLTPELLGAVSCVVILTDHAEVDYKMVGEHAAVVVDSRHVAELVGRPNVVGA